MLLSTPPTQARTGLGVVGELTKLGQEFRYFQKRWSITREWPEGKEGEEVSRKEPGRKSRGEEHIK